MSAILNKKSNLKKNLSGNGIDTPNNATESQSKPHVTFRIEVQEKQFDASNTAESDDDEYDVVPPKKDVVETEALKPGKTIADMPRLSCTYLRKAYRLLLDTEYSRLSTHLNFTQSLTPSDITSFQINKPYFSCAEFIDEAGAKTWLFRPIELSNKNAYGMDPLFTLLETITKLCAEHYPKEAKKGPSVIIPIGEEVYCLWQWEVRHFVTLHLEFDAKGKILKGGIYDSKSGWLISNLDQEIYKILTEHLVTGIGTLEKRKYIGIQGIRDHSSCGYHTYKIICALLNGDPIVQEITATLPDCNQIIQFISTDDQDFLDTNNHEANPNFYEHWNILPEYLCCESSNKRFEPNFDSNFNTIMEHVTNELDLRVNHVMEEIDLKQFLEKFMNEKSKVENLNINGTTKASKPSKSYDLNKDLPNQYTWSALLRAGNEENRRQICIDIVNQLKLKQIHQSFRTLKHKIPFLAAAADLYAICNNLIIMRERIKNKKENSEKEALAMLQNTYQELLDTFYDCHDNLNREIRRLYNKNVKPIILPGISQSETPLSPAGSETSETSRTDEPGSPKEKLQDSNATDSQHSSRTNSLRSNLNETVDPEEETLSHLSSRFRFNSDTLNSVSEFSDSSPSHTPHENGVAHFGVNPANKNLHSLMHNPNASFEHSTENATEEPASTLEPPAATLALQSNLGISEELSQDESGNSSPHVFKRPPALMIPRDPQSSPEPESIPEPTEPNALSGSSPKAIDSETTALSVPKALPTPYADISQWIPSPSKNSASPLQRSASAQPKTETSQENYSAESSQASSAENSPLASAQTIATSPISDKGFLQWQVPITNSPHNSNSSRGNTPTHANLTTNGTTATSTNTTNSILNSDDLIDSPTTSSISLLFQFSRTTQPSENSNNSNTTHELSSATHLLSSLPVSISATAPNTTTFSVLTPISQQSNAISLIVQPTPISQPISPAQITQPTPSNPATNIPQTTPLPIAVIAPQPTIVLPPIVLPPAIPTVIPPLPPIAVPIPPQVIHQPSSTVIAQPPQPPVTAHNIMASRMSRRR